MKIPRIEARIFCGAPEYFYHAEKKTPAASIFSFANMLKTKAIIKIFGDFLERHGRC
jgi:hypothetical protein